MGFENRDYYRDDEQFGFLGVRGVGDACKVLIAVNVAVFLLQIFTTRGGGSAAMQWLALVPDAVLRGQVWRVLTWGFGYDGSPLGFIFDMLFLWWFGKTLEGMYGTRELSLFYGAAVLLGSVACVAADAAAGGAAVVGSAMPVMAITVLFAWHFPRHKILLFFLIPVEIWLIVLIFVVWKLVAYATSAGGAGPFAVGLTMAAFGLAYGKFGWRIENLIPAGRPRLRLPKPKPKLKVFDPTPPEDLDAKVDAILAKIHEHGEASLSDRERKTLEEASRRYRKT